MVRYDLFSSVLYHHQVSGRMRSSSHCVSVIPNHANPTTQSVHAPDGENDGDDSSHGNGDEDVDGDDEDDDGNDDGGDNDDDDGGGENDDDNDDGVDNDDDENDGDDDDDNDGDDDDDNDDDWSDIKIVARWLYYQQKYKTRMNISKYSMS
ncbi:hypothetical protein ElyMa_003798200 [Elysia marginata]|uniref:Uncharacterized protein n=1 Tax=Elysia marginata TaxID=1093978 RepID=A0AAV4FCE9_9GAST|nr:hypothetical protein ElyMa_003798200 [Elysia marginata]